jgi:hypothetical protein
MPIQRRLDQLYPTTETATYGQPSEYQPPAEQPAPAMPQQPPVQQAPQQPAGPDYDALQPKFAEFRALDSRANNSDADLYKHEDFQNWLNGGQMPNVPQAGPQAGPQAPQTDIMSQLQGFFQGGQPNQDIINRRTEGARENLNRFAKSRTATNQAALANRGLIGDGPEQTAQNRVEEDLADRYSQATSQIYADESGRADDRMLEALRMAAGIETSGLDRDLSRTLGLGNLAVQNDRNQNDYSLGMGGLGLDRDRLGWDIQSGGTDQLLTLLQLMMSGANTSADGYI